MASWVATIPRTVFRKVSMVSWATPLGWAGRLADLLVAPGDPRRSGGGSSLGRPGWTSSGTSGRGRRTSAAQGSAFGVRNAVVGQPPRLKRSLMSGRGRVDAGGT
jgi:hypothetical protein